MEYIWCCLVLKWHGVLADGHETVHGLQENDVCNDNCDMLQRHIIEEVQKKQKDPERETDEADDFDSVFEDTGNVCVKCSANFDAKVVWV